MPSNYGESSTYDVNGLNQLTEETSDGSTLAIAYDKNGNLTSDGVSTFGYDIFNRLTSAGAGASFDYDGAGRLSSVTSGSTTTHFLYDGNALIGEYAVNGSGNPVLEHRYVHGLSIDTPIVWYDGGSVTTSSRRYLSRDELGSVVLITDSSGNAMNHNVYDEFGVPDPGNVGRFQYTGQAWLPEAGLYHYKARVYNPYLGRFHQTDPIGYGDGLNMYAYAGNDPINRIDPSGLTGEYAWAEGDDRYAVEDQWAPIRDGLESAFKFIVVDMEDPLFGSKWAEAATLIPAFKPLKLTKLGKLADNVPVRRTGPRGVDPNHHNANVTVRDADGNIVSHDRVVSGNMTPDEAALGFPNGSLASHTEARAVRNTPLQPGQSMTITGQNPPCPRCKGAMNQAAGESGATVRYQWRENGATQVWEAGGN